MTAAFVAISTVRNGTMYVPSDHENLEVINNRRVWLETQGLSLDQTVRLNISYDQPNFCRYRVVDDTNAHQGMESSDSEPADALVTTTIGLALFLPVADCVAATLFDEQNGVLMLAHLGRHSLEQQGGTKAVEFLVQKYGTNPKKLKIWLGPAPNKTVYPIFKLGGQGMKEAVFDQLQKAGVELAWITDNSADTATSNQYYSYSEFLKGHQPNEGRFAMVAAMQGA